MYSRRSSFNKSFRNEKTCYGNFCDYWKEIGLQCNYYFYCVKRTNSNVVFLGNPPKNMGEDEIQKLKSYFDVKHKNVTKI